MFIVGEEKDGGMQLPLDKMTANDKKKKEGRIQSPFLNRIQ